MSFEIKFISYFLLLIEIYYEYRLSIKCAIFHYTEYNPVYGV
jgi:hypothetical protein